MCRLRAGTSPALSQTHRFPSTLVASRWFPSGLNLNRSRDAWASKTWAVACGLVGSLRSMIDTPPFKAPTARRPEGENSKALGTTRSGSPASARISGLESVTAATT